MHPKIILNFIKTILSLSPSRLTISGDYPVICAVMHV